MKTDMENQKWVNNFSLFVVNKMKSSIFVYLKYRQDGDKRLCYYTSIAKKL